MRPVIGALACLPLVLGAQWVVDDDGPADFRSIQAAVDAAYVQGGDTILVRPGTYVGNVYLDSKDLQIRSEKGPFVTVLDARGSGSVVSLYERTAATVLTGFTVTGGRDQSGGGIWIYGGTPVVTRNVVQGNSAVGGFLGYGYGGGIEVYASAATITRNVIRRNTALDGGGGIDVYYASPILAQNTVMENAVTGAAGKGGGILSFASRPRITSSIVQGNQAAAGGGLYAYRPQGGGDLPDVSGNSFFANLPGDGASNGGWHLPASNAHVDARLCQGEGTDLWPCSDAPGLDAAEPGLPVGPDLWGTPSPIDSDLDGSVAGDVGAIESRGEITSLRAARDPGDPASVVLTWDDAKDPSVRFRVQARDDEPFVLDGGACLASGLTTTLFADPVRLPLGRARFYVVSGGGAATGSGGVRSDGTPRPAAVCAP